MKPLSEEQEASALYILEHLSPLIQYDDAGNPVLTEKNNAIPDLEAINQMMAAIHQEPGREPGPNCGCRECVTLHNSEESE